jgi:hypothetical protein
LDTLTPQSAPATQRFAHPIVMSAAVLLMPLMAAAESQVEAGHGSDRTMAIAHLNFRIIIPQTLYLHVNDANDRTAGAQNVAVTSNSHNVALTATLVTPSALRAPSALRTAPVDDFSRGVVLSSAARKVIAQGALCGAFAPAHGTVADARPVVCTASMP